MISKRRTVSKVIRDANLREDGGERGILMNNERAAFAKCDNKINRKRRLTQREESGFIKLSCPEYVQFIL